MELKYTPSAVMKDCPECGKRFFVLYPHLWAYKRRNCKQSSYYYYCSWKCLRAADEKKGEIKLGHTLITESQKRQAVQIAIDGGDPRQFLKECGSKNPDAMWDVIRQWIKGKDPEMAGKLPKIIGHKSRKTVETPEGEITMPIPQLTISAETPEAPKITKPLMHSGKTAIGWRGDFGEYIYDRKHGYIDFESNDGDELSMKVESWKAFIVEFQDIAKLMGVEL